MRHLLKAGSVILFSLSLVLVMLSIMTTYVSAATLTGGCAKVRFTSSGVTYWTCWTFTACPVSGQECLPRQLGGSTSLQWDCFCQ